jgi:hypothetical protein
MKTSLTVVGIIVLVIGFIVIFGISGQIGKDLGKYISKKTAPTPKQVDYTSKTYLNKVAEELNNKYGAPKQMDEDTLLEYVGAEQGKIIYHYQVINYSVNELNTTMFLNEDKQYMRKLLCSNDGMKMLLFKGISIVNTYIDKNGDTIGEVSITKNDCE